ncbi:MAG: lactate utilization protein [Firmicutes bacterium]|nr:lactate utilization protein [Bacillota bacterium]
MKKLIENLTQKGYHVHVFCDKESAAAYMNQAIDGKTVGIGGSVTVRQMGLYPMLSAHNDVCWHDEKPEELTVMEARKKATSSEVYISSVNGISETGEIVNIDNTGNRVAAISFGPSEVYLVIGRNKICPDLASALDRARNIAAPLNAQRLKRKTPCALKADQCYDCNSPERICRNLSVLYERPTGAEYHIILIDDDLGY